MGLFSKKPKVVACDVCGKTEAEGCGGTSAHIEQISGDQPPWLPENLRLQAEGEYTWLCLRCNSYPAMKWPSDGGASAGLLLHLGSAHSLGAMKGMGSTPFSMIPAG